MQARTLTDRVEGEAFNCSTTSVCKKTIYKVSNDNNNDDNDNNNITIDTCLVEVLRGTIDTMRSFQCARK